MNQCFICCIIKSRLQVSVSPERPTGVASMAADTSPQSGTVGGKCCNAAENDGMSGGRQEASQ
jgi:hypothetical protein